LFLNWSTVNKSVFIRLKFSKIFSIGVPYRLDPLYLSQTQFKDRRSLCNQKLQRGQHLVGLLLCCTRCWYLYQVVQAWRCQEPAVQVGRRWISRDRVLVMLGYSMQDMSCVELPSVAKHYDYLMLKIKHNAQRCNVQRCNWLGGTWLFNVKD